MSNLWHLGAIFALFLLAAALIGSLAGWRPGLWGLGLVLFLCATAIVVAAGLFALERVSPQQEGPQ